MPMNFHIKNSYFKSSSRSGFTLIEILVVIAIIGILSGLLFTNFSSARERSRDTKRKADFHALQQALQLYMNDYNVFPAEGSGSTGSGGIISGCGAAGNGACSWTSGPTAGSAFTAGSTTYMGQLPGDPLSPTQQYSYCAGADTFEGVTCSTVSYILSTKLENATDPDSSTSQSRCGVASSNIQPNVYTVCNQ